MYEFAPFNSRNHGLRAKYLRLFQTWRCASSCNNFTTHGALPHLHCNSRRTARRDQLFTSPKAAQGRRRNSTRLTLENLSSSQLKFVSIAQKSSKSSLSCISKPGRCQDRHQEKGSAPADGKNGAAAAISRAISSNCHGNELEQQP